MIQAFGYTVALVFVGTLLYSAYRASYGVFRIASPTTTALVSGFALAAASWILLNQHRKLAERLRADGQRPGPALPAAPDAPGAMS